MPAYQPPSDWVILWVHDILPWSGMIEQQQIIEVVDLVLNQEHLIVHITDVGFQHGVSHWLTRRWEGINVVRIHTYLYYYY